MKGMNESNLQRLATRGGSHALRGGHLVIDAGNHTFGFVSPPGAFYTLDEFSSETASRPDPQLREFSEKEPAFVPTHRALYTLVALNDDVRAIATDRQLSEVGRSDKRKTVESAAVASIAANYGALRTIREAVDAEEVALFAAPKIAAGDVEAVSHDRELREWFNGLNSEQLAQVRRQIFDGSAERLTHALLRSPIASSDADDKMVRGAWRAAVVKREPERAAKLASARASADWADHVVSTVARYLARDMALSKFDTYRALSGAGGHRLFGIADASVPIFDQRIAAEKSRQAAA